jgi:hypothetical protein
VFPFKGHACALSFTCCSDRTTWPDNTEWFESAKRLPQRSADFFRLDRLQRAGEHGEANVGGGGERLMAVPVPADHVDHGVPTAQGDSDP